jgi:NAD(P)-dependent dehydrogenase (short-subunit alcohol dehydrogenase family)
MKFQNKVAVITGGSGIGLATARRFVAEGAHVFITGCRRSELDQAKTQLGGNVTAVQGDVAKLDDLDMAAKAGVRAVYFIVDVTTDRLATIAELFDRKELIPQVGTVLPATLTPRAGVGHRASSSAGPLARGECDAAEPVERAIDVEDCQHAFTTEQRSRQSIRSARRADPARIPTGSVPT